MNFEIADEKNVNLKDLDLFLVSAFAEDDDEKKRKEKQPLAAPKELSKVDKALQEELMKASNSVGFAGKSGQSFILRTLKKDGPAMLGLLGLGPKSEIELNNYRKLGGIAFKASNEQRSKRVGIALAVPGKLHLNDAIAATLEGFQLAKYRFDKYLSDKPEIYVDALTIVAGDVKSKDSKEILARAEAITSSVCLARDLINEGPLEIHPAELAKIALKEGNALGLDVEVLDEKALAKENMNLMLAVARAAINVAPPRLIRLAYRPKKKAKKHIVLVGKGVTFDCGGLDIKPADGMRDMKVDMSGAACVLGTLLAIAKLKPDVAVTGYMVCVENGIGSNAYHPGDIIKSRKGLTIEIDNTDAEGRLILADGLDYAQTKDKPDVLIDIATLTGAVMVGLGPYTAGILSNSDKLAEHIYESGKKVGEDFWRLPLNEDLRDNLKSSVADMKNSGSRLGGAITGALFLKSFVGEKVDWAHLDIAGPATTEKDHSYNPRGGTGFAVRTLVDYICRE